MKTLIIKDAEFPAFNGRQIHVDPSLVSDNNTFKFKPVPSLHDAFLGVYYKGQRIAIINGLSAPLQWTAKNGSNIPVKVIDQLTKMVVKLMRKTHENAQI